MDSRPREQKKSDYEKTQQKGLGKHDCPISGSFSHSEANDQGHTPAARNMGMGKVGARSFDTRPQFFQREPISMGRESVIDPHHVIQSQGPQV